jgi:hypothetical protein
MNSLMEVGFYVILQTTSKRQRFISSQIFVRSLESHFLTFRTEEFTRVEVLPFSSRKGTSVIAIIAHQQGHPMFELAGG